MNIGAVSGYGSIANLQKNYRVNAVYGNPKSLEPVQSIGQDSYSGNPFAVISKKPEQNSEDELKIKEQQAKPFDLDAAIKRAEQGMTTAPSGGNVNFDINGAMSRLMQGTRFSADTIPVVELTQGTV